MKKKLDYTVIIIVDLIPLLRVMTLSNVIYNFFQSYLTEHLLALI